MAYFGNVKEFDPSSEDFNVYIERLDLFFEVNEIKEERKVLIFLHQVGANVYKTLKSLLSPALPRSKSYKELVALLKEHFEPVKSVIVETFKFNNRSQRPGETINSFAVELQQLASSCDFGAFLDRALRDRFICGLHNEEIRRQLLNCSEDTSFARATRLARGLESAGDHSRAVQSGISSDVKKVQYPSREGHQKPHHQSDEGRPRHPPREGSPSLRSQGSQSLHQSGEGRSRRSSGERSRSGQSRPDECRRCGRRHLESTCPARGWTCYTCQRVGHTSKMCSRRRRVKQVEESVASEDSFSDEEKDVSEYGINKVCVIGKVDQPLLISLCVNGKVIDMEIDCGSACSIISSKLYTQYFKRVPLVKSNVKLRSVVGEPIPVQGKISVSVRTMKATHQLTLVVTKAPGFQSLLGRPWLDALSPEWRESLSKSYRDIKSLSVDPVEELKEKFPRVFSKDNSGSIKGFVGDIVLKEGATPIFHKAYSVPYALREQVEKELLKLESSGIIKKTTRSQWASPLVVVPKKEKGTIRLCVDYKVTVNRVVDTEHYPLPRLDDVLASLGQAKVFTVLDLSNAYQQLEVSDKAQDILTINTHMGLFKFTRLPYGVQSAPAIFQSVMDQVLHGLPKVTCYLDDVLIVGETKEENRRSVELVLRRLEAYNIRVNLGKCKFFETSVLYLGHQLDATGIHPHKEKVEAILKAPAPMDVPQLRSYLGLLNFYNRFLPNLAAEIKALHQLLEKGARWEWTDRCQEAFDTSKALLVGNQLLVTYDPSKEMIISCDASQYGVGAVLSHVIKGIERPVMFVSATLSKSEQGYAQVEKEALAIIFGVKRFHKYIMGHKFKLVTDHLPLKAILGSKRGIPTLAASRLQRWAIILAAYEYEIEYRKGSELANADAMSRLPLPSEAVERSPGDVSTVKQICEGFGAQPPCSPKSIAKLTAKDVTLSRALTLTQQGWAQGEPKDPNLMPYFQRRNELSIDENCLTWGNRVIIPLDLRDHVLSLLHDQHPGIVRMKMLARSNVWWPNIDQDIENRVLSCEPCQLSRSSDKKGPLQNWPTPGRPWQRVHIDFGHLDGTTLLVMVDSYSKWVEVWPMASTTAKQVIEKLRNTIATFGVPELIVSDNGPPFNSVELEEFCLSNGIKLEHSPPYHPASNGQAERTVRTVKEVLAKYHIDPARLGKGTESLSHRIDKFLFAYRNTPTTATNVSPAEILLKVKPRTQLSMLKPNLSVSLAQGTAKLRQERNSHCNMGLKEFLVGERVLVRKVGPSGMAIIKWQKGEVKRRVSSSTYLVEVNGRVKLTHCDHLRHSRLDHTDSGFKDRERQEGLEHARDLSIDKSLPRGDQSPIKGRSSPLKEVELGVTSRASPNTTLESNGSEPTGFRRSGRQRKAPEKLDL